MSALWVRGTIKSHVKLKSNLDDIWVRKFILRYQEPHHIVKDPGHNYFEVHNCLNKTESIIKYKHHKFYLLPLYLFLSEPLDITSQHYLKY